MGKLNAVIAVVAGKKKKATETLTQHYHKIEKAPLFSGIKRVYSPLDAEGERYPSEEQSIQVKVSELIRDVTASMTEMLDVIATQDTANTKAKADVTVNGTVVLSQVPVTHLLFLDKQLTDIATFVSKLPTLDPAEDWEFSNAAGAWATKPTESIKTKKIPFKFVKAEATQFHPAQVDVLQEDKLVGYWKTIKFSGAIPTKQKIEIQERVQQLQEAVIKAREEANSIEAAPVSVGKELFGFIFGQ